MPSDSVIYLLYCKQQKLGQSHVIRTGNTTLNITFIKMPVQPTYLESIYTIRAHDKEVKSMWREKKLIERDEEECPNVMETKARESFRKGRVFNRFNAAQRLRRRELRRCY